MNIVLVLVAAVGLGQTTSDYGGRCHVSPSDYSIVPTTDTPTQQDNCYQAIQQQLGFCTEWLQPSYGQHPPMPVQVGDGCHKGDKEARISSACSCFLTQIPEEPLPTCVVGNYGPPSCGVAVTDPCYGHGCEEPEPTAFPTKTECVDGYGSGTCRIKTTETCDRYECEEPGPTPTPGETACYGDTCACVSCEPSPVPTSCYENECESEHISSPIPTECHGNDCPCDGHSCELTTLTTETTDLCYGDKCTPTSQSATKSEKPTLPTCESYSCESSAWTSTVTKTCHGGKCSTTNVESTTKPETTMSTQGSKIRSTDTAVTTKTEGSTTRYTTSTIFTTTCIIVTTCDHECPHGPTTTTTTEIIPVTTTVCPVTDTPKPLPLPETQKPQPQLKTTAYPPVPLSAEPEQSEKPEESEQPPAETPLKTSHRTARPTALEVAPTAGGNYRRAKHSYESLAIVAGVCLLL